MSIICLWDHDFPKSNWKLTLEHTVRNHLEGYEFKMATDEDSLSAWLAKNEESAFVFVHIDGEDINVMQFLQTHCVPHARKTVLFILVTDTGSGPPSIPEQICHLTNRIISDHTITKSEMANRSSANKIMNRLSKILAGDGQK